MTQDEVERLEGPAAIRLVDARGSWIQYAIMVLSPFS
jgi:hypothetical protein